MGTATMNTSQQAAEAAGWRASITPMASLHTRYMTYMTLQTQAAMDIAQTQVRATGDKSPV